MAASRQRVTWSCSFDTETSRTLMNDSAHRNKNYDPSCFTCFSYHTRHLSGHHPLASLPMQYNAIQCFSIFLQRPLDCMKPILPIGRIQRVGRWKTVPGEGMCGIKLAANMASLGKTGTTVPFSPLGLDLHVFDRDTFRAFVLAAFQYPEIYSRIHVFVHACQRTRLRPDLRLCTLQRVL